MRSLVLKCLKCLSLQLDTRYLYFSCLLGSGNLVSHVVSVSLLVLELEVGLHVTHISQGTDPGFAQVSCS